VSGTAGIPGVQAGEDVNEPENVPSSDPADDMELAARQGCAGWALWYVASGFFAITGLSLFLGALDTNIVLVGIGLVALIPGVLIGRPGLRRLRALWAAERRADEWTARQPGGKQRLRARHRRATITAATGIVALFGYLLIAAPLLGAISVVGTLLVLLPFVPHIRRQIRWYRNLVKP
jgi:hypothetical protein